MWFMRCKAFMRCRALVRRGGRVTLGVGVSLALAALASPSAQAQEPTASWMQPPSTVTLRTQLQAPAFVVGEPTGPSLLAPWAASTPLRLSLQSGIFPIARGFPNCISREEPSGNTVNGMPVQRYASLRLSPALVLHGFSSAGCPVDGAVGGGITYSALLRPSLWLVAGIGAYGVPAHAPVPARVQNDTRIDVMHALGPGDGDGRTLSVGVGKRGVSLGGIW
jgi:hypothetical protein